MSKAVQIRENLGCLELTAEIAALLGGNIAANQIKVNSPMIAMDTINIGDASITLSVGSDGYYMADVIQSTGKRRKIAVTTTEIASQTPILGPTKFLETIGVSIPAPETSIHANASMAA